MPDYDNKGRFGIWKNRDRKEATHPHLAGQGESLDGSGCWVSAWFSGDIGDDDRKLLQEIVDRHSANSKRPFISVSIKAKESGANKAYAAINGSPEPAGDSYDDDIPF